MTPLPGSPGCPHYPDCVGCPLIGTAYGEQLRLKRERLAEVMAPVTAAEGIDVPPLIGSPRAFGYRTQAKLVLRRAGRGLLAGVYRPGTHQVVDIRACPVHHPLINEVVSAALRRIEEMELSVYDERTREGLLRYLVVRVSAWQKQAQLIVVATGAVPASFAKAVQARVRGLASVVVNLNSAAGNVVLGPRFLLPAKTAPLVERIGELRLRSRPGAFLQANVPVARRLYETAASWAGTRDEIAVDLYCGVGALAFHLAPEARRVYGIEENEAAVLDAKENTTLNGFHNVRFRAATAAAGLAVLREELGSIGVVALNPPRKGADEETRHAIAACSPRAMVYVSCNAETLARDLAWFAARGYRLSRLQGFDMLPQTDHVEVLALLERVVERVPVA